MNRRLIPRILALMALLGANVALWSPTDASARSWVGACYAHFDEPCTCEFGGTDCANPEDCEAAYGDICMA